MELAVTVFVWLLVGMVGIVFLSFLTALVKMWRGR